MNPLIEERNQSSTEAPLSTPRAWRGAGGEVSIVIPTYRRPQLLLKCLQSLSQQRFPTRDMEIVVVTDGPDEMTKAAVQHFAVRHRALRMHCIHPPKKGGPAAARNRGWEAAKGELVLFTDDDTLPHENWVSSYCTAYVQAQKTEIAFTGKTVVPLSAQPTDYEKNTAGLETAEFITANCACSRAALEKVGGFDEQFTMAWREDSDLHFKLLKAEIPILKVAEAVVIHPVRQAAWGVSIREQKKGLFNALLYKKHPQLYSEKIGNRPLLNYYCMIGLAVLALAFGLAQRWPMALAAAALWLLLVLQFAYKRLRQTSKQPAHILEMLYTSAVIPFHSVYWTLYGSIRFKKWLF